MMLSRGRPAYIRPNEYDLSTARDRATSAGLSALAWFRRGHILRLPDRVLFDRASRPEFGAIEAMIEGSGPFTTEVNHRSAEVAEVVGLFEFGSSFGIDGSLFTSDLNFHQLFPDRPASNVDVGLIYLEPGADPRRVRDQIADTLPEDVDVMIQEESVQREIRYWNGATPIGYIVGFGVVMGIVVGMVIVYQIQFSDVQDSLKEYATVTAMRYTHRYLVGVVMSQAVLLGILGYVQA